MVDFMVKRQINGREEWQWKAFGNLGLNANENKLLLHIFSAWRVMLIGEKDEVIWCGAKEGNIRPRLGIIFLKL